MVRVAREQRQRVRQCLARKSPEGNRFLRSLLIDRWSRPLWVPPACPVLCRNLEFCLLKTYCWESMLLFHHNPPVRSVTNQKLLPTGLLCTIENLQNQKLIVKNSWNYSRICGDVRVLCKAPKSKVVHWIEGPMIHRSSLLRNPVSLV